MKITLKNQTFDMDFNINKEYPVFWYEVDGKRVDEVSISPVKGYVKISGDIEIQADIPVRKIYKFARVFNMAKQKRMQDAIHKIAS